MAVCMTMSTAHVQAQGNLGSAYISNVVGANGECAVNTQDGNSGTHKWDLQAGGTYTVTLTGATDCDHGVDTLIGVIVHNSCGTNIYTTATYQSDGVYTFNVTIPSGTQCGCTMPIEYCTSSGIGIPANNPGSGFFAQGYNGTVGDGKLGHLRVSTFDAGTCNVSNPACPASSATPTPTPCTGSITACKYYDTDGGKTGPAGKPRLGWPFCLKAADGSTFTPVQQSSANGSCTTFSNLPLGSYTVTEGTAGGTWTGSTISQTVTVSQCDIPVEVDFGNYCTVPSGGLTLGFWSNKNGNKVLTGVAAGNGANLLPAVTNLLNAPCAGGGKFVTSTGTIKTFTGTFADLKDWLLRATATNMAYMLSAQEATLLLDTHYGSTIGSPPAVDGNAFDLGSGMTVNGLLSAACDSITGPGNQYTLSGNPSRPGQEMLKNCIDAINNNGQVIPVTPCDHSGASVTCGQ